MIRTIAIVVIIGFLPYLLGIVIPMSISTYIIWSIIFIPIAAFLIIYFVLAPNNCFFTFVKESTVKFVVKGDKFDKCLIRWEGYTFDYQKQHPEKWNVIKGKEKHRFGGLCFYGLWPLWDLHIYKFRWTGVDESGTINKKHEWLDYMLLKDDVYFTKIAEAEDKNLLPLEIQIYLTIRVVNPYKARFAVQNWLETIINRMQPIIRQYIAKISYTDLGAVIQTVGGEMWEEMKKSKLVGQYEQEDGILMAEGERGEFIDQYGVEVKAIEIRQIDPPEEFLKTTLLRYTASETAEATKVTAKATKYKTETEAAGERKATILKAEGEAKRMGIIFEQIKHYGDLGKLVRTLEAMEKSPLAASMTVQAIPGLSEALKGIFGKSPNDILPEEIQKLKEDIKRLKLSESKKKRKK
ncbi:MAG: SPFH domain-containing protein [Patescibacteria group bacterium]|nr:hypothetical protein [Patescibacteria group bacterium]MBU1876926.1 hypothetical protein [Patescibacteria group bacterium]